MRPPIFVRPFSDEEQQQIQAGLHSKEAFVLRRCQILMTSARGERAMAIAEHLGCDDQTVRNVIHGFNRDGLAVLQAKSSRPHHCHEAIADADLPRLQALLPPVRAMVEKRPVTGPWTCSPRSVSSTA